MICSGVHSPLRSSPTQPKPTPCDVSRCLHATARRPTLHTRRPRPPTSLRVLRPTSRVLGAKRTKGSARTRTPQFCSWSVEQISAKQRHLPGLCARRSTTRQTSFLPRVSALPARTNAASETSDNSPTCPSIRNDSMDRAVV
jgi:hypothetical protein